jgi:Ca2+-binding RTX toxin-like protein
MPSQPYTSSWLDPLEARRLLAAYLSVIGETSGFNFAQGSNAVITVQLKNVAGFDVQLQNVSPAFTDACGVQFTSGVTLAPNETTTLKILPSTTAQGTVGCQLNADLLFPTMGGGVRQLLAQFQSTITPPTTVTPNLSLATLTASPQSVDGAVTYDERGDGTGGRIVRPRIDVVSFNVPFNRNDVAITFQRPQSTTNDAGNIEFALYPDTDNDGTLSLAERASSLGTWSLSVPPASANVPFPPRTDGSITLKKSAAARYFMEARMGFYSEKLGGYSYTMSMAAADAGDPQASVTSNGSAVANNASVNLGSVNAGGTLTRKFTLKNTGPAAMTITSLTVTGTQFEIAEGLPATLAPGASNDFTVELASVTAGGKSGTVKVVTDDPATPTFTINLSATVTGAPGGGPQPVTVNGTTGDDVVTIAQSGATLSVTLNGTKTDYDATKVSKLIVLAGPGNDKLLADATVSVVLNMTGEGGDDTLQGGVGNDELSGANGKDKVWGGAGNDYLLGGAATDKLYGEDGNDTLSGAGGRDFVYGGAGSNYLLGGAGNDLLYAKGNNTGGAKDTLSGNAGTDLGDYDNDDVLAGLEGVIS